MNHELINKLKIVTLFLTAVSVSCAYGKILGLSVLLGLVIVTFDKERFYYLKKKIFVRTLYLFSAFVTVLLIISIYQDNLQGVKYQLRYIEKIVPFLIIYLLIGKINVKVALKTSALGILAGTLVSAGCLTYDYVFHLENYAERYGGLFGHPNKLGGVMAFLLSFAIYFACIFRENRKMFDFMLLLILLLVSCLIVTKSRGAWISFSLELILGICYYQYKQNNFRVTIKSLIIGLGLLALTGVLLHLFAERSYDGERILLWKAAWNMFADHPILGVGVLRFNDYYVAHYISALAKEPNLSHPHNLFLWMLSETGIVGFCSYLFMVVGILKLSLKDFYNKSKNISLPEVFAIALVGTTGHAMVDVICTTRDFMLLTFFFWGLSCMYIDEQAHLEKIER